MTKTLLFATNNPHKLEEIREIAGDQFKILSLTDIGYVGEIPETSDTIAGNALQKATFLFEKFQIPVFADDTGLEVEGLGGAPGVISARYAGPKATYAQNVAKLLAEMEGMVDRRARFVTIIALIEPQKKPMLFEGIVEGIITLSARGSNGFGYDPVFLPDGYELTYAEMGASLKNLISHRAMATQKLIDYLRNSSP